jgi:hypothetical protein
MRIVFDGVVPKELEHPDNNEDAFAAGGTIIAVSDGASESFDSRNWSRILVDQYVASPQLNELWLTEAIGRYAGLYQDELSWSKQASFERGSFATLLGIVFHEELNTVDVLAIGDSLAVLIDNGHFNRSFPYTSFKDFDQKPALLSTIRADNDFINQQDFLDKHTATWDLQSLDHPLLLCMTDALGQWFLKKYQSDTYALEMLLSLQNKDDMQKFISILRKNHAIRNDDTTLIVVDCSPRK